MHRTAASKSGRITYAAIAAITTGGKWSQPGRSCEALSGPEAGSRRVFWVARDRSGPLTLAVDAMGGDNAPDMVVQGLDISAERHPSARFLLIGDEPP